MNLGAFSISLTVRDLSKPIAFYEDLGVTYFGGTVEHSYAILKNRRELGRAV